MARPKRSSTTLQKAEQREAALQSISSMLDLSNGLTLASYSTLIEDLRVQIADYNKALSNLDEQSRQIKDTEQKLRDLSEQMLLGVAAKYGKNSREYGKAGGVPKTERRRARKSTAANNAAQQPATAMVTPIPEKALKPANGNGKTLVS